jgi:hypothetical protein
MAAAHSRQSSAIDPAQLRPALQEALTARTPTVLDMRTSLDVSFADITSPLAVEASPRRTRSRAEAEPRAG